MTEKNQTMFPSETIELPSKGYFYPKGHPLSKGTIELKYPTAREEDILTSKNLIKQGIVIERFLESLIVDKSIKLDDILIGDKNAITYAARILAYGSKYKIDVTCPNCSNITSKEIDLNEIKHKEINLNEIEPNTNIFEFTLPFSKIPIKFKILNNKDELNAELLIEKLSNNNSASPEITSRLQYMIVEVDGETDKFKINKFIDSMLSRDSLALRREYTRVTPDIDTSIPFSCEKCSYRGEAQIPLGVGFFWPSA